jgi:hypothetical protein
MVIMADTYYAWSIFDIVDSEKPEAKPKRINPGDAVTADLLDVTDEDWNEIVASGAVRTQQWPVPPEAGAVSPIEYLRSQAANREQQGLDAIVEELSAANQSVTDSERAAGEAVQTAPVTGTTETTNTPTP